MQCIVWNNLSASSPSLTTLPYRFVLRVNWSIAAYLLLKVVCFFNDLQEPPSEAVVRRSRLSFITCPLDNLNNSMQISLSPFLTLLLLHRFFPHHPCSHYCVLYSFPQLLIFYACHRYGL